MLPVEANRKLYLPRIVRRLNLAEVRVLRETVIAHRADRVVEVGAIEQVVELRAESQHPTLAEDLEALLNGEVHIVVVGPMERVPLRASRAGGRQSWTDDGDICGE